MASGIEDWLFFDVESGQLPDGSAPSSLPGGGKGRIVVVAATPFARQDAWAGKASVILAREWAQEGLRIFLMDLSLEEPLLHEALGIPNGEGVSEAFLFGASVQHIAKPALDNAIFFASAGAPPGDPEEVLGHPRWNDLAGGFSEADATLLLFLPTDIAGAGKILSRATDIVFLAGRGESADVHLGPASVKVVATLGPLGMPPEDIEGGVLSTDSSGQMEDSGVPEGFLHSEMEPGDSGLGFEGTLELAEGFAMGLVEEESLTEAGGEGMGLSGDEEGAGESPPSGFGVPDTSDGFLAEGVALGGDAIPGEKVADSVAGTGPGSLPGDPSASEDEETEASETAKSRAPDFEAHFVDLPPADEPEDTSPIAGGFGGDLVQGPDFGAPSLSSPVSMEPEPPTLEVPPRPEPGMPPTGGPRADRRRPPKRKPPKKRIPWGTIGGILLAAAILVAAVGTALGRFDVPGFTFLRSFFSEVPDPPLTLAGPQANEEVLRYSLVLFEYDQDHLADALEMLAALEERLPDLLLTLVPRDVDGERAYALLAGPAVDRVEAENLRGPIAEVLIREDPASWSVRETPRAFYLGERGSLSEAEDYLASVVSDGLHAYILHATFNEPEGGESYESYQVLTGAFAGVQDARALQLILRDLGFMDAPLIERRGRLPE